MKTEQKIRSLLKSYLSSLPNSESLCEKCPVQGSCCYSAVKKSNGDVVGIKSIPCKYLSKGQCTVYENRHELNKSCLPIIDAIMQKAVPNECLYVSGIKGYEGKIIANSEEQKEIILDLVKSSNPDNLPTYLPDAIIKIIKDYHNKK